MKILLHDGGGMLGAFGIGAFDALRNEYGIDHRFFDVQGGTSCGAWNAAYIRTGQIREGINLYVEDLTAGFIRRNVVSYNDMAFLEKVTRNLPNRLCIATLKQPGPKVFATLTDTITLGLKVVCVNEQDDPIVTLLRAAFIPGLSKPTGEEGDCDGGLMCQPPIALAKLLGQGSDDEVWLISPRLLAHRVNALQYRIASWILGFGNSAHRRLIAGAAAIQNAARDEVEEKARSGSVHVICPAHRLPISWRSTDKEAVRATVELGRVAARDFMRTYRHR